MDKRKANPFSVFDFGPGEVQFVFSRSSGPGGQNVNKVNTRATLIIRLAESTRFNSEEKNRIRHVLKHYLDKSDCIQIHCQQHRSQWANRNAAAERLEALLQKALAPRKVRKKVKIPRGVIEKRLQSKKRRAAVKQSRGRPGPLE